MSAKTIHIISVQWEMWTTLFFPRQIGAVTLYAQEKESPHGAVIGHKVETLSLPDAISSVLSIFRNEIDKMMTAFKKPSPHFYNGYFAARIIVNRAATRPPKRPETPHKP